MPAKDIFHEPVKRALIKDGWTITHDPLSLKFGSRDFFVDLGAERLVAAQKGEQKIAVEIKSFLGRSEVTDLERALGQFVLYHDILSENEPNRKLYLAISNEVWKSLFVEEIGRLMIKNKRVRIIVVDSSSEVLLQWIE